MWSWRDTRRAGKRHGPIAAFAACPCPVDPLCCVLLFISKGTSTNDSRKLPPYNLYFPPHLLLLMTFRRNHSIVISILKWNQIHRHLWIYGHCYFPGGHSLWLVVNFELAKTLKLRNSIRLSNYISHEHSFHYMTVIHTKPVICPGTENIRMNAAHGAG